jgi:hypothetical protein
MISVPPLLHVVSDRSAARRDLLGAAFDDHRSAVKSAGRHDDGAARADHGADIGAAGAPRPQ